MTLRVEWSPAALAQLRAIIEYVEQFDEAAAFRLAARLHDCASSLETYPNRGRRIGGGRRQLSLIYPYIISYRVLEDRVEIDSVRHGARAPEND